MRRRFHYLGADVSSRRDAGLDGGWESETGRFVHAGEFSREIFTLGAVRSNFYYSVNRGEGRPGLTTAVDLIRRVTRRRYARNYDGSLRISFRSRKQARARP